MAGLSVANPNPTKLAAACVDWSCRTWLIVATIPPVGSAGVDVPPSYSLHARECSDGNSFLLIDICMDSKDTCDPSLTVTQVFPPHAVWLSTLAGRRQSHSCSGYVSG